jgi:uncharacterized membrane protein YkvA (DUF1232 family)
MTEKPKRTESPASRGPGFFRQLIDQFRLSWALLQDNRVSVALKVIPIGAVAYLLSPLDLIPDILPVLGQLDDLGVLMTALTVFNNLSPAHIVAEHVERLRMGSGYVSSRDENGTVIDVKAKPK